MEAIVLAGGFGTRLRSEVPDLPKAMAPVAGRPFLEILLDGLARQGFSRIVLSLGYMAPAIMSHFGASYRGMALRFVVEEQPLGTGGAIRLAMTEVADDHVFVFNGDTFLDLDCAALEAFWQQHRKPVIVGRPVADVSRYGRLVVSDDRVVGFAEKGSPGAGLINAGCYVFPTSQFDDRALHAAFSLEQDFLARAVPATDIRVFPCEGQFIDIGVPEDYRRAQVELAMR